MHHDTSFYYSSSPKQDAEKDDNIHIDNHNNGIGIDVNSNDINNDKKKELKDNEVLDESGYNHRNSQALGRENDICSNDLFELGDTKQIQLKDIECEISSDKMTCSSSCNSREIGCDQMIDDLGDESYNESGTE